MITSLMPFSTSEWITCPAAGIFEELILGLGLCLTEHSFQGTHILVIGFRPPELQDSETILYITISYI